MLRHKPKLPERIGLIADVNTLGRRCFVVEGKALRAVDTLPAETDWIIAFEKADMRFSAPKKRSQKDALAQVLSNPDADEQSRMLNLSGEPYRALYARSVDAIMEEPAPITPGVALLDLLRAQKGLTPPTEPELTGFLLGELGPGCVGVLIALLPDGAVKTQIVLDPDQERLPNFVLAFSDQHRIKPPANLDLFTLDKIREVAATVPTYDREERIAGVRRSQVEKAAIGLLMLGLLAIGGTAAWRVGSAIVDERASQEADARTQGILRSNATTIRQAPLRVSQQLSLPLPQLFMASERLWHPDTTIRFDAGNGSVVYTVTVAAKGEAAGNASSLPFLSRAASSAAVQTALTAPPPAGLTRSGIKVYGDLNAIDVDYSQALPNRLGGLVAH